MTGHRDGLGVHSETGRLRKVIVCSPGRAHERLTPQTCDARPFDDVVWVHQARIVHRDFREKLEDRGVEVLDVHDLLTETLGPEGVLLPPLPNMMFAATALPGSMADSRSMPCAGPHGGARRC